MKPAWAAALLLSLPLPAVAYEQRQGPALLRVAAQRGKDDRIEIPLSGVRMALRIEGKAAVRVLTNEVMPASKTWKLRPLAEVSPAKASLGWVRQFYLEPLAKPGEKLLLQIPPLTFAVGKQPARTARWQPIRVRITTEIKNPSLEEMRPITGPEPVPPAPSWRAAVGFTLSVGVLGALFLLAWEVGRRRFRQRTVPAPEAWAMRELGRLGCLDFSGADGSDRFATALSDVVRRYLELRFRLQAPRQTTTEFLSAMQDSPQLSPPQQELLRDLLERCDLAKFARAALSAEEGEALIAQARGFIHETAASGTSG
jgi:hypothetical protein